MRKKDFETLKEGDLVITNVGELAGVPLVVACIKGNSIIAFTDSEVTVEYKYGAKIVYPEEYFVSNIYQRFHKYDIIKDCLKKVKES